MKKLVIAFAACALAGLASAQVYSANIVGYRNAGIVQGGFLRMASTFVPVGTDGSAATLGCISANENFAPFEDSVQIFDASGALIVEATYASRAALDSFDLFDVEAGWWRLDDSNFEFGSVNGFPLPYGWAFTAFSGYSGAAIVDAGEVVQTAVNISLAVGQFTLTGNVSPVDLTLGNIVANENFAPFEDSIQIFDASGALVVEATYASRAALDSFDLFDVEAGWWRLDDSNFEFGSVNSFALPAGHGFTAFTGYAGTTITIPNPIPAS